MPDREIQAGTQVAPGEPPPPQRRARASQLLKRSSFFVLYALAMVALFVGGLKLIDQVVANRNPPTQMFDAESTALTIRTLELYPYDGFHMQANFRHRGPMPWDDRNPNADFDVRTGDKGFFIDFPLDNPPAKGADEFRIILVGGSGAQGWGGTRNDKMFYSVLERLLNARFNGRGVRVRVINLAMGGTTAYQNFLSLNLYAHALEPDLILAYVGRNDFFVPLYHEEGHNVPLHFNELNAFSLATRGSEYPDRMGWLVDFLPNIMCKTSIGLGIKIGFGWPHFQRQARQSYANAASLRWPGSVQQMVDDSITPRLVHSLKSIKRDFDGVPVMVAWQPIRMELIHVKDILPAGFYDRMYERTRDALSGYMNGEWFFVNVHQMGVKEPKAGFETHLDDQAHALVGQVLSDQVGALIPDLIAQRQQRLVSGLPAYGR